MKRIIFLLFATLMVVGVSAQQWQTSMDLNRYVNTYTGVASDTSSAYTVWNKAFLPNKGKPVKWDIAVKITEVTATTNVSLQLQGKKFGSQSYVNIGSPVRYYGGGTDTTVIFTENSTASYYNYFNVNIAPVDGKVKTTSITAVIKE